jgi:hypothetical protein
MTRSSSGSELRWRKSRYSSESANCVEFAPLAAAVAIRDSKDPEGAVLSYGNDSWARFTAAIRAGVFDRSGHTE